MKKQSHWGYVILVVATTLSIATALWWLADGDETVRLKILTTVASGAVMLVLRGPILVTWDFVARRTAVEKLYQRDAIAGQSKIGGAEGNKSAASRCANLRMALRACNPKLPRVLVVGDAEVVRRLLPTLSGAGSLVTPEALFFWGVPDKDGMPDVLWLKCIFKLRRHRPIDAVLVFVNGDEPLRHSAAHAVGLCLSQVVETLRWSAPVYLLEASRSDGTGDDDPVVTCRFAPMESRDGIASALQRLRYELSQRSIHQLITHSRDRYHAELAARLDVRANSLANWLSVLSEDLRWPNRVDGVIFIPDTGTGTGGIGQSLARIGYGSSILRRSSDVGRMRKGRPTAWHPVSVFSTAVIFAIGALTLGGIASAARDVRAIHVAQEIVDRLEVDGGADWRARELLALQQQIAYYVGPPQSRVLLLSHLAMNRESDMIQALWKHYAKAARQLLITPVQHALEASLTDLSQLQTARVDDQTARWAMSGRDTLKAYLMLANPDRVEPDFLASQMAAHWSTDARLTSGEKQDLAERLARFYADHLKSNETWKTDARPDLVGGARRTLLAIVGQTNAQDTLYRGIVDGVGSRYPDLTLAQLTAGTDTRGLLRSSAVVPGVFTRQAYEGYVADAIDAAAKRRDVAADWVLSDDGDGAQAGSGKTEMNHSADEMRAALTAQYFSEYAEHWQAFMNALQWEAAPTLPASIDQLKQMTDARQSPIVALMKSLAYQGGAGAPKASLADALVDKTKSLFNGKGDGTAATGAHGPLDAAFGPVLRLGGQPGPGVPVGSGDLSLQRYFDRATALRLRLQQITQSADGDGQARQLAQALFQGRASELADTQAYAQLMAASLGVEWAGMGEALFVRPVAQAAQAVLRPAQASLDEAWRQHIAMAWGRAFAGRYPFASTANDASLPELVRFLRPRDGLIHAFLGSQLAGVLELQGDQWVPVAASGQRLDFDPNFLKGINALQRIGARLLVQGEPQFHFALKPIPTPGLTDTLMTVDGQTLHYFNQREAWHATRWPADNLQVPGTRLQWRTESAGTSKHYEFGGRWGWIRMLEHADVEPIDSATFQLTWQGAPDTGTAGKPPGTAEPDGLAGREAPAPESPSTVYPIRYQMRTEAGQGPLELLALRGFVLPSRIFADSGRYSLAQASSTASN